MLAMAKEKADPEFAEADEKALAAARSKAVQIGLQEHGWSWRRILPPVTLSKTGTQAYSGRQNSTEEMEEAGQRDKEDRAKLCISKIMDSVDRIMKMLKDVNVDGTYITCPHPFYIVDCVHPGDRGWPAFCSSSGPSSAWVYDVPNGTIFRTKKLQLFTVLAEHKAFIEGVPITVKCLDSVVSSFLPWAEVSKSFSSFKLGVKLGGGGYISQWRAEKHQTEKVVLLFGWSTVIGTGFMC